MAGQAQSVDKKQLWGGGQSPFSISYGKMMMWFFLVSDALTFGGLLIAYGVIRHASSEAWPIGEQVFEALPFLHGQYPLIYVAFMTFILIISSVTMVLAVEAGHRMDKAGVIKWMGYTVVGGFVFLGSQVWEWSHFIHGSGGAFEINQGLTIKSDDGLTYEMNAGSWVHMGTDFGHAYEHAIEHGDKISWEGNTMIITPNAHDCEEGHGDHSAHGHGEQHGETGHGEHLAGHSETAACCATEPQKYPLTLVMNKYTLVCKDEVNYAKMIVTGDEAMKIWKAKEEHTEVFGANLSKNEYGQQQQYANYFFFITGFHGFHVFQGVIINLIVFLMAYRGVFERRGHYEMVEKVGLFWHFVDLVWVFVFTFFYLV
jgi:cytochrome c oxidase subunit III